MEVQKQIGDTVWQNNRKNANSGAVRAGRMGKGKKGGRRMLTLFTAAAVFGRLRRPAVVFEPPGAEGRIFLGEDASD